MNTYSIETIDDNYRRLCLWTAPDADDPDADDKYKEYIIYIDDVDDYVRHYESMGYIEV